MTTKRTRTTRPLRSRPITGPSPLLRGGPSPCRASVLSPSQFQLLGVLPSAAGVNTPAGAITARGSHVSCQRPDRARATSVPGNRQGSKQVSPGSSRGNNWTPVTIAVATLTTLQQWFTHVRLPGPHLTHHVRLFRGAHHPGSFTGATRGGLQPPPAGRLWRACLHHRHNTATISAIFYIATSSRARGAPSSAIALEFHGREFPFQELSNAVMQEKIRQYWRYRGTLRGSFIPLLQGAIR